ncbi:ribosomal RNA large subunit methyltransferaseK/L [Striga asiatica]|uniref:Ribosomal RNA large subunit methyltransferaseK/L n=1 Tax=Striga asiatica TaxID=4170 RepID=A0A5A7PVH5_STRAF|nr:ribosomal RNA large subunit methyltransferaseK/L [Striga asiatica]
MITLITVATQKEDEIESLVPEDLRLHELDGDAVDLDQPAVVLAMSHSDGRFLAPKALYGFSCHRHGYGDSFVSLSQLGSERPEGDLLLTVVLEYLHRGPPYRCFAG